MAMPTPKSTKVVRFAGYTGSTAEDRAHRARVLDQPPAAIARRVCFPGPVLFDRAADAQWRRDKMVSSAVSGAQWSSTRSTQPPAVSLKQADSVPARPKDPLVLIPADLIPSAPPSKRPRLQKRAGAAPERVVLGVLGEDGSVRGRGN